MGGRDVDNTIGDVLDALAPNANTHDDLLVTGSAIKAENTRTPSTDQMISA